MPEIEHDTGVTPEEEPKTPPEENEEGTGGEAEGDTSGENEEGTGDEDRQTPPEENEKRVRDLQSKWDKAESENKRLAQENEELRKSSLSDKPQDKPSEEGVPAYRRRDWQPKTIAELQEALIEAEEVGFKRAAETVQSEAQSRAEADRIVDDFFSEVKGVDKEFDEDAFAEFASEHKFPLKSAGDLRSVYSAFIALRSAAKKAGTDAVKNRDKRNEAPVRTPGSGGGETGIGYSKIHNSGSALDLVADHFGK